MGLRAHKKSGAVLGELELNHLNMSTTSTHSHRRGVCPIIGRSHEWCPPQEGDSRSPCPALNTLANHGYLYVFPIPSE